MLTKDLLLGLAAASAIPLFLLSWIISAIERHKRK
jgi:hypothetical protein